MKVAFAARTDTGRVREHNEDNYLVDRDLHLYVVCDGMGGHAAGDVASATAVNMVRDILQQRRAVIDRWAEERSDAARRALLRTLEAAIQKTCLHIFERGQRNASERGMGTTLTLLLLSGGRAFYGHVGDSRIYLLRDGEVHQITDDHSLLADMLRQGRIRSANEVDPQFRNAVTRAVGVHETVEVDTLDFPLLPNDRYLLCSDGLTGYADADLLGAVLDGAGDEAEICEHLVRHANDSGGIDNITTVVVTIEHVNADDTEKLRRVLQILRGLTLFRYLSYAELVRVWNISRERRVAAGETIFARGDAGTDAFVILDGRVRVSTEDVQIAALDPGRHFGEMAWVDDKPRMADAVAIEDSWLLAIPRESFYETMRRNPTLAVKLLWSFIKAITHRLRLTTGELNLTKQLFHALSPQDFDKLPHGWLPPDSLGATGPRADSGPIRLQNMERAYNDEEDP